MYFKRKLQKSSETEQKRKEKVKKKEAKTVRKTLLDNKAKNQKKNPAADPTNAITPTPIVSKYPSISLDPLPGDLLPPMSNLLFVVASSSFQSM